MCRLNQDRALAVNQTEGRQGGQGSGGRESQGRETELEKGQAPGVDRAGVVDKAGREVSQSTRGAPCVLGQHRDLGTYYVLFSPPVTLLWRC